MKVNFCICKASPPDCPIHAKKRSKYGAEQTVVDGITFQSRKEARRYGELCLARQSGELLFFLRQVPFHLVGGNRYLCDFVEFWRDGSVRFVDTKGFRTPMYRLKKRQVEATYPVVIEEV